MISGSAQVVILATGDNTYVAGIAATLPSGHAPNAFDYAVRRVVYLFIIFLGFMCPIVIVLSGVSTGQPPTFQVCPLRSPDSVTFGSCCRAYWSTCQAPGAELWPWDCQWPWASARR